MDELNENEREALRILWQAPDQKPAEIQAAFGWSIENATLRSVLRNLLQKGYLSRKKSGKAFAYRARTRRSAQFSRTMQRMAEVFTGGSKTDLIMELLRREKLSDADLAMLKEITDQRTAEDNSKGDSP
ncbi:BlaI/MecI/CopY family transcriptional regulator [Novipirellula artificiosorum]|uniref:Methicillin resistance regulatory protein MecI n=1 Tax=Novipirellula artificiosorum TaxID=2528016 RepID=A0A5C6DFE0_9BACT|nr:BlaI/MecI/CopY family transcriptional regulator [Novipirellula artificiosorum]TWU35963.1 Methicillin resistance regulatory protein MecI [Novipirellula artificiosorum]